MPFGFVLLNPLAIFEAFAGGQGKGANRSPTGGKTQVGVFAQIADQDNFVNGHDCSSFSDGGFLKKQWLTRSREVREEKQNGEPKPSNELPGEI